jgi:hypothetical protein
LPTRRIIAGSARLSRGLLGLGDIDPAGAATCFADDAIAALADAAGAATSHAGLLDDRRNAAIVHRKAFSENHFE